MRFGLAAILLLSIVISFSFIPYLSVMDKHILVNIDSNFNPHIDIFTGNLPYIVSYNEDEGFEFYLKLYSMFYMLPQETNVYLKIGKTLEAGYIDEYSKNTPFYQMYLGRKPSGNFYAGITSKIGNTTFGLKSNNGKIGFCFGTNTKMFSFSMYYESDLDLNLNYRFKDFYTLHLGYSKNKVSVGMGISWFNRNFFDLPKTDVKYFAHRGQLNKYPENSKIAFSKTIKDNEYIGCETDVNITKDKKYAVIHDPFMFRFAGNLKLISQYNMKDLEKINIAPYFHYKTPIHILELKELEPIFSKTGKILLIETKIMSNKESDVKEFLKYVNEHFDKNTIIWFSSLDPFWVKEIKKLNTRKNSKVFYIYPFIMVSQSDYIYPLIYSEFKSVVKDVDPDGIIWFKPKTDLFYRIEELSKKYSIDMLYWDFANQIYYYKFN